MTHDSLGKSTATTVAPIIIQSSIILNNQSKKNRHEIFKIKRRPSYDIRAVDFEPPYFDFIIAHIV